MLLECQLKWVIFSQLKSPIKHLLLGLRLIWHGHECYLDGKSDVRIGTEAPSSVTGAVMETSSWETENPQAQCQANYTQQAGRCISQTSIVVNVHKYQFKKRQLLSLLRTYKNGSRSPAVQ